jgi:hypothetical protein
MLYSIMQFYIIRPVTRDNSSSLGRDPHPGKGRVRRASRSSERRVSGNRTYTHDAVELSGHEDGFFKALARSRIEPFSRLRTILFVRCWLGCPEAT